MTLTYEAGATTLQTLVIHPSREDRDGHPAAGMEPGMQLALDRLDDLVRREVAPATRGEE